MRNWWAFAFDESERVMLTIDIPVCDKIIVTEVYINVDVKLHPIIPPQFARETIAIEQVRTRLNAEIYAAVKSAMETLTKAEEK